MTHSRAPYLAAALLCLACVDKTQPGRPTSNSQKHLMTAAELMKLIARKPDYRLTYGQDTNRYGELRLPKNGGPHPVVSLSMVAVGCPMRRRALWARSFERRHRDVEHTGVRGSGRSEVGRPEADILGAISTNPVLRLTTSRPSEILRPTAP